MRNLSLARLKKYVNAYNIRADGVLEKDDLIERIIAIRVGPPSIIASIVSDFLLIGEWMSTIRQRGNAAVTLHLLYCVCSISIYRASTGSIQFPTVELGDPAGCSQDVRSHNLYTPPHRESLLAIPLLISLAQTLIQTDSKGRHLGRRERRLILRLRPRHSRNLSLARSHTITHVQLLLRWQHQDPSIPVRATIIHRSLDLTRFVPVTATRLIQRPAHRPPHLYRLSMNYWQ